MLEILKSGQEPTIKNKPKMNDIIITKYVDKITYTDNKKIIESVPVKTNLTKKINETAKLVKENRAQETLAQLEEILKKETNSK